MFCPKCHAEYRPGFEECSSCKVALVQTLQVDHLTPEDVQDTLPVGRTSSSEVGHRVTVHGQEYDLMRLFTLGVAMELQGLLTAEGFGVLIKPVDEEFPDQRQLFEVRVRTERHAAAEEVVRAEFARRVAEEGVGAELAAAPVDTCPACGAHVPLEAEECPDCGLVVGVAGDDDEGGEAEEDEA